MNNPGFICFVFETFLIRCEITDNWSLFSYILVLSPLRETGENK